MPTLAVPEDPPLPAWPNTGLIGVLDLEYTAWNGSAQRQWSEPWEWREIVQIGFLLVDAGQAFSAVDEIEVLVKPVRNPTLSDYFVTLTGIRQSQLEENAQSFPNALDMLSGLMRQAPFVIFNGNDGAVFRENCELNGISFQWRAERWYDLRPLLAKTINVPPHKLISSDLPALAGVAFNGHAHSALSDCRAVAAALSSWRTDGQL